METTNPALARLDAFVGQWELQAYAGGQPVGGTAQSTFAWMDDAALLVQHAEWEPDESAPPEWVENSPFPVTTVVGLDDATGEYTQLHADARGVCRVYRMTFDGHVWKVWRDAPGFAQRLTATFSADGRTITGQWELSTDNTTWTPDFDLTYTKVT